MDGAPGFRHQYSYLPRVKLGADAYPTDQSNRARIRPNTAILEANEMGARYPHAGLSILCEDRGRRNLTLLKILAGTCEPWGICTGRR